jgi:hypothetical protein
MSKFVKIIGEAIEIVKIKQNKYIYYKIRDLYKKKSIEIIIKKMSTIENYILKHKRKSKLMIQVYVYISLTKYALKLHLEHRQSNSTHQHPYKQSSANLQCVGSNPHIP